MPTSPQRTIHDLGTLRIPETKRGGGSLGRRLALFFGLLVILGGASGAIYSLRSRSAEVEVVAARSSAGRGGREALLNASGYVTPQRRATIAAKITGRVTGVFFDEGTHVHTGQLLATLDDSDAKKALGSAIADRSFGGIAIGNGTSQRLLRVRIVERSQELAGVYVRAFIKKHAGHAAGNFGGDGCAPLRRYVAAGVQQGFAPTSAG